MAHIGDGYPQAPAAAEFFLTVDRVIKIAGVFAVNGDKVQLAQVYPAFLVSLGGLRLKVGRLAIRHRLNDFLLDVGGHIGYDVRPSRRREGHAREMLRQALPWAHGLGIDSALVTCDDDNAASLRVIEAAGGVLEDVRGVKRRYWVRTS